MRRPGLLTATLLLLGSTLTACTTTYTEADLREDERQEDANAHTEDVINDEIGDAGGDNQVIDDEEDEEVFESDL